MTDVGDPNEFVDSQGVQLTNVTDSKTYIQTLSVQPANLDHSVHFHQLTNDQVEKTFGLTNASFDVLMMVTTTELGELITLSAPVQAQLTTKTWKIDLIDQSGGAGGTTTLEGTAVISSLKVIDDGIGSVTVQFTLDFVSEEFINP